MLSKNSAPMFSRPLATDESEMDSFHLGMLSSMCRTFQVSVANKSLSGADRSGHFLEDKMDPICLHFGLSPEFTGNLFLVLFFGAISCFRGILGHCERESLLLARLISCQLFIE